MSTAGAVRRMAKKASTLYVRNLPWTVSSNELLNHFRQFGYVNKSQVQFGKDGMSRGFGYVEFRTAEDVDKALSQKVHLLEGRQLEISTYSRGGY